MLSAYDLSTGQAVRNATFEVNQQVILAGLYHGGFFDKAAFYGALAFAFFMGCKDSAKIWISLCLRLTTILISRCIFSLSLMSLPLSDELLTLRRRTKKALVKLSLPS